MADSDGALPVGVPVAVSTIGAVQAKTKEATG